MIKPIVWKGETLEYLDQTRLPLETLYHETADYRIVAEAIKTLAIRGAPLIGVSAAYGYSLGAIEYSSQNESSFHLSMQEVDRTLRQTRPTAVNLFWALDRMSNVISIGRMRGCSSRQISSMLIAESQLIEQEDARINETIARYGASLIEDGDTILTHCNAGALACSAWGTALGAIAWAAINEKKDIRVYVDETRPLLQGARLTAYELQSNGIPVTLICDNMTGYYMSGRVINRVMVGADRIASNGDVANKIGTYGVAVLSRHHGIPFYVAAPLSTFDFTIHSGIDIPIEQRDPEEVTCWYGRRSSPPGISVGNPAFDVTPASLVDGIITEQGIMQFPYEDAILNIRSSVLNS